MEKFFKVVPMNEERSEFGIVVGKHLATEKRFETELDAEEYMNVPEWDTVFSLVAEMLEIHNEKQHKNEK